jgi:molecular chaperone DnaK (HSP70)
MSLDLDGILKVTAIEKKSGLSKNITIARALEAMSEAEIAAARKRLETLYATRQDDDFDDERDEDNDLAMLDGHDAHVIEGEVDSAEPRETAEDDWSAAEEEGRKMIERSRLMLDKIHDEDREETIDLNQAIESAIEDRDATALKKAVHDLREMLFFVEGRA